MGFIKIIGDSIGGQLKDQYREVIRYDQNDNNILVKKITTDNGVITNQSRLFVQPGQCAIYTDNGAIKDIISEPGMYFMDTSAPSTFQTNIFKGIGQTFLESMKRIAYEGNAITAQAVYFINLTEKTGFTFGTSSPIMFSDPVWGPMEIRAHGYYSVKVNNPVNLLTNYAGVKNEVKFSELSDMVDGYVVSGLAAALGNLGVSFDVVPSKQLELARALNDAIDEDIANYGIEIAKVVLEPLSVPEEIQKSMRERASIKLKASAVDQNQANIYTQLNTAEAIKDMANNENGGNGATIMGMGLGSMMGGMAGNTINNSYQQQTQQPAAAVVQPTINGVKCSKCGNISSGKFCSECGTPLSNGPKICPKCNKELPENAKFCSDCGTQL